MRPTGEYNAAQRADEHVRVVRASMSSPKDASNSAKVKPADHPSRQAHHAPLCGTSGPYGVMYPRLCVLDTAHGPPARRSSPVTLRVMDVEGFNAASEYSSVKRSYSAVPGPSEVGMSIVTLAPLRTRKV